MPFQKVDLPVLLGEGGGLMEGRKGGEHDLEDSKKGILLRRRGN